MQARCQRALVCTSRRNFHDRHGRYAGDQRDLWSDGVPDSLAQGRPSIPRSRRLGVRSCTVGRLEAPGDVAVLQRKPLDGGQCQRVPCGHAPLGHTCFSPRSFQIRPVVRRVCRHVSCVGCGCRRDFEGALEAHGTGRDPWRVAPHAVVFTGFVVKLVLRLEGDARMRCSSGSRLQRLWSVEPPASIPHAEHVDTSVRMIAGCC
mmetsp:Transcript_8885/g.25553  ORF Transcript_8885/g.25553 Transcript_8885/m.25553 type:complete len:204 (-) Transcript_8885:46-657(-)